jgi:subtilisin-like proprotein convertase family protein
VAGVAAAVGGNNLQGVGAAFGAQFSELRIGTDDEDALALGHRNDLHDVKNNSWGPDDNGTAHVLPAFVLGAIEQGVHAGRGGQGTIFVWAAGNGGNGDRVEYDPLAASRYTLAVGAIGDLDARAAYSERGSSLALVAPSNGNVRAITTTTNNNGLTSGFGGTSSAAPVVSGVAALLLEARPSLHWRDVHQVLMRSARRCDPGEADWVQNAAGRWVNYSYGFGAVDAGAAVALAQSWERLPHELATDSGELVVGLTVPDNKAAGVTVPIEVDRDLVIESVELYVDIRTRFVGDLQINLASPGGTISALTRKRNDARDNYANYRLTTLRHLDERSAGTWQVNVADLSSGDVATWDDVRLVIYGRPGCPGDLDEDGGYDLDDLLLMLGGFGPCEGQAGFDPAVDTDNSGCHDMADVLRVLESFGVACPA